MADLGSRLDELEFFNDRGLSVEREYYHRAVIFAIDEYRKTPFRWNRKRIQFETVADQSVYSTNITLDDGSTSVPASDIYDVIRLNYTADGSAYPLRMVRDFSGRLDVYSTGSVATGRPYRFDWEDEEILVWPTPADTGDVISGVAIINVSDLDEDSAESEGASDPWLNEAWGLIRPEALRQLYLYLLSNEQKSLIFEREATKQRIRFNDEYQDLYASDKDIVPNFGDGRRSWMWGRF